MKINFDRWFFIAGLFLFLITLYLTLTGCKSIRMFYNLDIDEVKDSMYGIEGAYYLNKNIYCVNVEGRTKEEINNTDYHEMCHYLVEKDYQHFCNST